jgi:hypothetical protein
MLFLSREHQAISREALRAVGVRLRCGGLSV